MSVPTMIGRYRLGPRLGAGGCAVVWLAHDESLDTTIAIKVLADNWIDEPDVRERFLAEARMLRRASSSRIVQVFDVGELPDGRPYFVMEHADLGTLEDRLAKGRLPLVEALRITAEVARAAAELHRLGIVHRDLKPSNVLIRSTPDGRERLLLSDLGLAKNLMQGASRTMSVGSAGYMAPEQAVPDSRVDARADVYSLGALGFDLITGRQPPTSGPVLPKGSDPDLPEPVRKVLAPALEPDRDRRWQQAADLAQRLDELADQFESVPHPGSPASAGSSSRPGSVTHSSRRFRPVARLRRRRSESPGRDRRTVLAAGLAIVMIGGAGLWLLGQKLSTEIPAQSNVAVRNPAAGSSTPAVSPSAVVPRLKDGIHYGLLTRSGQGSITVRLVRLLTGEAEASAKCRKDLGPVPAEAVCRSFYLEPMKSARRTLPISENAEITYVPDRGEHFRVLPVPDVGRLSSLSKDYQLGQLFVLETKDGIVFSAGQVTPPCKDIGGIVPDGEIEWTSRCVPRSA